MEVLNNTDFFDESTGLLFHLLDYKDPRDSKSFKTIDSWSEDPNINGFLTPLSDLPLAQSLIRGARWGSNLYAIQNTNTHEMEVIGTALLVPNTSITGYPELKKYFNENKHRINDPSTNPNMLDLKAVLRLLNPNLKQLYIQALAVNPEKQGLGYGSNIIKLVAENCGLFNEVGEPLCTSASVYIRNNHSLKAFLNAGFKTIPEMLDGYFKLYKMNEKEFTF